MKGLFKSFKPQITPAIASGEAELITYLKSVELQEGEAKAIVLVDYTSTDEAVIAVATVDEERKILRVITHFKKDKIVDLIFKLFS
jgi:hypothetical protein